MTATAATTQITDLLAGVSRAADALAGRDDSHTDLLAIRDDLRTFDASEATSEELLASYDTFQARLATFHEAARQAAVAHDQWSARGAEGDDPAAAFARGDLLVSDTALRALYEARSTATGVPVDSNYSMYTPEGNAAVHAAVLALAAVISSETLSPNKMLEAIRTHIREVAKTHGEVHDTESEWAVVDALNPLLRRAGYAKIDRDHL